MRILLKPPFFASIIAILLSSCYSKPTQFMQAKTYSFLNNMCSPETKKNMIVYYFDGDCALCIGRANYLTKKYLNEKDYKTICIAKTLNPDILYINLKRTETKLCLYVDKLNKFEKVLPFDSVIVVDEERAIKPYSEN